MAGATTQISIGYDPVSWERVRRMGLWGPIYAAECQFAMEDTTEMLEMYSHSAAPHPGMTRSGRSTGALGHFQSLIHTPFRAEVDTPPLPYAQRVHYGFSGMTDSLGRFYPEWPLSPIDNGYRYFEKAIYYNIQLIAEIWYRAGIEAAESVGFTII